MPIVLMTLWLIYQAHQKTPGYRTFPKAVAKNIIRHNKKPRWVIERIIQFKAIMNEGKYHG